MLEIFDTWLKGIEILLKLIELAIQFVKATVHRRVMNLQPRARIRKCQRGQCGRSRARQFRLGSRQKCEMGIEIRYSISTEFRFIGKPLRERLYRLVEFCGKLWRTGVKFRAERFCTCEDFHTLIREKRLRGGMI